MTAYPMVKAFLTTGGCEVKMTHGSGTLEVGGEQFAVSYELSGDRGVFHGDMITLATLFLHVGREGVLRVANGQSLFVLVGNGKSNVGTTVDYIRFTVQHHGP